MSLQPQPPSPIPEETARVAHAAFPHGSPWMRLRDELGPIFDDAQFTALFPSRGRPAETPWRLALVTVMQFAERLSDRDAANVVRGRIDWKYALGLPLDDPGFDASVLCEFRARLVAGSAELLLLETLLTICRERRWLRARGRQRTDSTHVLSAIRGRNRVETVRESMRYALNVLAELAPEWLLAHLDPAWAERYRRGWDDERLPSQQAERDALVAQVGADGLALLRAVRAPDAPSELARLPALEILPDSRLALLLHLVDRMRMPASERRQRGRPRQYSDRRSRKETTCCFFESASNCSRSSTKPRYSGRLFLHGFGCS
jgi:transposase